MTPSNEKELREELTDLIDFKIIEVGKADNHTSVVLKRKFREIIVGTLESIIAEKERQAVLRGRFEEMRRLNGWLGVGIAHGEPSNEWEINDHTQERMAELSKQLGEV